jgi:hypothetical protein
MGDIYSLLAEQRIREYELHLRHVDEVVEHAEKKLTQTPGEAETRAQLEKLKEERDRLACWLKEARCRTTEDWRQKGIRQAGPMGILDAIAQQVEKLVERIER